MVSFCSLLPLPLLLVKPKVFVLRQTPNIPGLMHEDGTRTDSAMTKTFDKSDRDRGTVLAFKDARQTGKWREGSAR